MSLCKRTKPASARWSRSGPPREKGRCVAYWRPAHGSPERFLCAADADACRKHPHLRELLIELAAEVALNRKRAAGDSVALRVRAPISGRAGAQVPK